MARTPSNMIPLDNKAQDFLLPDTISKTKKSLGNLKGKKGTVVMFICNHCPFVIHVNSMLVDIANSYSTKEISFIAISSNDVVNYPQDSPNKMKVHAQQNNYSFPYLYDETQEIAKAYNAACTPDIYIFDDTLSLVYRGQIDDSRPGNGKLLTGDDLKHALDCLLIKTENERVQKPSIGCNIKWKG